MRRINRRDRNPKSETRLQFGLTPPPSIRWRLMLLVGLLLMVLIGMRYAAQPANWAWMGFPANENPSAEETQGQHDTPAVESDAPRIITGPPNDTELGDVGEPPMIAPRLVESDPKTLNMEKDFWTRIVQRLDEPSRMTLFALFRPTEFIDKPASADARSNLIQRLEQLNDSYTTDLLAQSGDGTGISVADQKRWYDALFAWQQHWTDQIQPVLAALQESGVAGEELRERYDALAQTLRGVAADLVIDKSAIGRPIEIPFWNSLFDRLRSDEWSTVRADSVQFVELQSQPQAYRGKPVQISGRIRGVRLQPTVTSASIPFYIELWIQPDDGSSIPFCVYALEMPPGFPPISEQRVPVDMPATVVGLFFKTQSYITDAGKTRFCPVILTKRPAVSIPVASATRTKPPSPFAFTSMTALIVLVAAWIAFRIYQSTKLPRRVERANVHESLEMLESDPRVTTVKERLARWSQNIDPSGDASSDQTQTQ